LKRLYLVAALAILYGTTQGMTVQVAGLRKQVDPHKHRGLSYLKIGLRYLQGVLNKGRQLISPIPLLIQNPALLPKRLKRNMTTLLTSPSSG
jgi:hypothetical protein